MIMNICYCISLDFLASLLQYTTQTQNIPQKPALTEERLNKSQQKGVKMIRISNLSPNDVPVTPVIHDVVERVRSLARLIPATDGSCETSGSVGSGWKKYHETN